MTPVQASARVSNARPDDGSCTEDRGMDENSHPKGALLFMIVYLLLLAGLWLNVYLRLW